MVSARAGLRERAGGRGKEVETDLLVLADLAVDFAALLPKVLNTPHQLVVVVLHGRALSRHVGEVRQVSAEGEGSRGRSEG